MTAACLRSGPVELASVLRERALNCEPLHAHLEHCVLAELRRQRSLASIIALEQVEVRTLQALEMLALRIGEATREGCRLPMILTRQELAGLIGTSTETCIRVISRLRREGTLREGDGVLTLGRKELTPA